MTNSLLKNQKKALDKPAPTKKTPPKTSTVAPAPRPIQSVGGELGARKVAGLPEERYYAANSAMEDMMRAGKHQQNKRLMGDVAKVAAHKMKELSSMAGGGKKRGG